MEIRNEADNGAKGARRKCQIQLKIVPEAHAKDHPGPTKRGGGLGQALGARARVAGLVNEAFLRVLKAFSSWLQEFLLSFGLLFEQVDELLTNSGGGII